MHYDLVIVLGAQIILNDFGEAVGQTHTQMRSRAAALLYHTGKCKSFLLCGGQNVGVRYSFSKGDCHILDQPDYSFERCSKAQLYPSEAEVMAKHMTQLGVPQDHIVQEKSSVDTIENAAIAAIMLRRWKGINNIGLLTSRNHIERATRIFAEAGITTTPLVAEEVVELVPSDIPAVTPSILPPIVKGYDLVADACPVQSPADNNSCSSSTSSVGSSSSANSSPAFQSSSVQIGTVQPSFVLDTPEKRENALRLRLKSSFLNGFNLHELKLQRSADRIGSGYSGQVYKGMWHFTPVAVKQMPLTSETALRELHYLEYVPYPCVISDIIIPETTYCCY